VNFKFPQLPGPETLQTLLVYNHLSKSTEVGLPALGSCN